MRPIRSAIGMATAGLVMLGGAGPAAAVDGVTVGPGDTGVAPTSYATCVQPVTGASVGCSEAATLWYNSIAYGLGSGTKFTQTTPVGRTLVSLAISNLAGYTFQGSGAGQGQAVKNNAAASTNNNGNSATYVSVWFNSGFKGAKDLIPPATTKNLVATKNDNASLNVSYYA